MAVARSNEPVDAILAEWFGCAGVPRDEALLDAGEELDLARRAQEGDPAARDRLILANLKLVTFVARRFRGWGLPFDDLLMEGSIGLLMAVGKFEPWRGARFATYALLPVRQRMVEAIAARGRAIRVPPAVAKMRRAWLASARDLAGALGREPTGAEVDAASGLSAKRLAKVHAAGVASAPMVQSSASRQDRHIDPLASLPDDGPGPAVATDGADEARAMDGRLDGLPLREAAVLRLFYGMEGAGLRDEEIAGRLGVSRQQAHWLRHSGLARLRGDKAPQSRCRRLSERAQAGSGGSRTDQGAN